MEIINVLALAFIFLKSVIILPSTFAASPDQSITYLPRHQTPLHTMTSSDSGDFNGIDRDIKCSRTHNSNRMIYDARIWSAKRFRRKTYFFPRKEKKDWRETTRLVGGANLAVDIEDISQQSDSSSSSSNPPSSSISFETSRGKKSFLGDFLVHKRQSFLSKETEEAIRKNFQYALTFAQKTTSRAGPSLLTALSLVGSNDEKNDISILTLYVLALLGASCGFHLFLHFITLGYALGVTLPLAATLYFYQRRNVLPIPTILHSSITILWGIRLFAFLAIREYITWPALHEKVVEVQAKTNIPFASKILCWFVYSFFYVSLAASCWSRLLQSNVLMSSSSSSSSSSSWGLVGYAGLLIQLVGLSLETIADLQKNAFKSRYRHSWCNIGVWKLSTHPNYLGEGLFWWGTYLAHGFYSPLPSLLATIGLGLILFVLKGSAKSLSFKQKEKYGQEVDFHQFQRTHNVFGPKHNWRWYQRAEVVTTPPTIVEII